MVSAAMWQQMCITGKVMKGGCSSLAEGRLVRGHGTWLEPAPIYSQPHDMAFRIGHVLSTCAHYEDYQGNEHDDVHNQQGGAG